MWSLPLKPSISGLGWWIVSVEVYRVTKTGGIFLICNEVTGDTDKNDKWTQIISDMTIYRDVQLKTALEEAGFTDIQIHKNTHQDWLCVTGQKLEKHG